MKSLFSSTGAKGQGTAKPAAGGAAQDLVRDGTDRSFMADVVEASKTVPVIVDFWATWCGPCKQLGPALERLVRAAKGGLRLVKIDIDRNPQFAGQLRVKSIPAVFAFFQGQPVDGFMGAVTDSQLKTFVERLLKLTGGAGDAEGGLDEAVAEAQQLLEQGDAASARDIFTAVLEHEPNHGGAYAGLVRCHLATNDLKRARQLIDTLPEGLAQDKAVAAARAALEVAEQGKSLGPIRELRARVEKNPGDLQARFDLALALFAAGQRDVAMTELLDMVKANREWNDQQSRKQLVKFFEVLGPQDPLTLSSRRRLSSILFS